MTPTRAPALPAEERRQTIIDAVIPLLLEHGPDLTTRQIAAAAGVAEGTLFRVFEDKSALLHAAVRTMLDPDRTRRLPMLIDPRLSLEEMLATVTKLMLQRMGQVTAVLMALRGSLSAPAKEHGGRPDPPAFLLESQRALLESLTELFGRYREELRVEPANAALVLRAMVFGARHPGLDTTLTLTADDIAAVLLTGISTTTKGRHR